MCISVFINFDYLGDAFEEEFGLRGSIEKTVQICGLVQKNG